MKTNNLTRALIILIFGATCFSSGLHVQFNRIKAQNKIDQYGLFIDENEEKTYIKVFKNSTGQIIAAETVEENEVKDKKLFPVFFH